MSWSVNASGRAKDVAPAIAQQISNVNLTDAGEMETVKRVGDVIAHTLGTFDPEKPVSVLASGSMGFIGRRLHVRIGGSWPSGPPRPGLSSG